MAFGLANLYNLLTVQANKLFNKKQNKIKVSFMRPNYGEEGDIWIDTGEHPSNVFNKEYVDDNFLPMTAVIEEIESSVTVDLSAFVMAHIDKDIEISADIINNEVDKYIYILGEVRSNWMLTSGRKEYDRMYGMHFKTAYYGYYTPNANWNQDYERPPVPIGSLQSSRYDIDGKPFYVLSLMAYYDEKNTKSGNGFNVLFTIRTPDKVIPFDSITFTIKHQFRYPKRKDVVYTKTIMASDFSSDDLLVRHATWADETNGSTPKLFEILYDLNHYADIPINLILQANVDGNTYDFTKTESDQIQGKIVTIPVEENRKLTESGDIDIRVGYNILGKENTIDPIKSIVIRREKNPVNGTYTKYLEVEMRDNSFIAANVVLYDNYDSAFRVDTKKVVNNTFKITDPYIVSIWSDEFDRSLSTGAKIIYRIEDKEDQIHYVESQEDN